MMPLEQVVHRLSEISHMKSSEKKEVILEYLAACEDNRDHRHEAHFITERALSITGPFHGIYERQRMEPIREESCRKNQSGA